MSATNLEACVAAVRAKIASLLSFTATEITDGRQPKPSRGAKHAHIYRVASNSTHLIGAKLRAYVLEVEIYRRGGDRHEEDAIDEALQANVEALFDAFDGKDATTYTTITGLEVVRAEILTRDDEERAEHEQSSKLRLTFPCYETA